MSSFLGRVLAGLVLSAALVACGGTSFEGGEGSGGSSGAGRGGSGGRATGGAGGSGGTTGGSTTGGSGGTTGGSGGDGVGGAGGSTGGAGGMPGGAGGASASGGTSNVGGDAGSAGTGAAGAAAGTCGFCPRVACAPVFTATVSATNGGAIADLKAEGDFAVSCSPSSTAPCQWICQAQIYQLPSGQHSITLTAPGYDPTTVDFSIAQQTCGCCGCGCTVGFYGSVTLDGEGEDGGCCANRAIDPQNCGECGNACPSGSCAAGACSGTDCQAITTLDACENSSDCHSVFDDPGTCGCATVGCCARYSYCASGERADCTGTGATCEVVAPHCDDPAYVISYSGTCYEGCVDPKDCAP